MKHKLYESYMNGEGFTYMVAEGKSFAHDDRIKLSDPLAVFNLAKSLNAHKFSDEHVFCFCVNARLKFLAAFEVSSGAHPHQLSPFVNSFRKPYCSTPLALSWCIIIRAVLTCRLTKILP